MKRAWSIFLGLIFAFGSVVGPAHADDPGCGENQVNCPHTGGDQEGGSVVTEATEFPNAGPGSDLAKATEQHAGCTNCEWSLVPACSTNGPTTQGDVLCNGAVATCQVAGQLRYRVYMRRPPGPWLMQGTVCLGRNQRPPTVADVGDAVRERVVNYLPDADPSFQPAQGGIVNLPTLFAAGEPRTMRTAPFDVLGFRV
ncbi:MAG: hypothetical protein ACRDWY_18810, partial [Actinomycetes bacterium]